MKCFYNKAEADAGLKIPYQVFSRDVLQQVQFRR